VTISYYAADSHSDNHVTDSTRQTEYTYTLGSPTTLERKISVANASLVSYLIDLATTTPMRIVESIKLEFGATGAWQLGEPMLKLDAGDTESSPPRDPVTPHSYLKEFEHYQYRRGGISACVDGQYLEGIAWPDSSHGNTLEPTGGHFDYRVGATSGIDFTTAWSLEGYLDLIERCCDAWETSYNTSAAEDAFKDSDGNWLKTPACFDLRPVNRQTGTACDVAVRVGQWTTAAGLRYDFTAEKIVRTQAHGWALSGGERARNVASFSTLWRRKQGSDDSWTEIATLSSDGHGHWHSDALDVVAEYSEDTATLWEYATGAGHASIGRGAVREYFWESVAATGDWPFLVEAPWWRLYLAYTDGKGYVAWRKRFLPGGWRAAYDTGLSGEAPAIAYSRGLLRIDMLHGTASVLKATEARSDVNRWAGGDALQVVRWPWPIVVRDRLYVLGYADGKQKLYIYNRNTRDLIETHDVGASDEGASSLMKSRKFGYLLAGLISGNDTILMRSEDDGVSWETVETVSGLTYPCLCDDGRHLYLAGYSASLGSAVIEQRLARDLSQVGSRATIAGSAAERPAVVKSPTGRVLRAVLVAADKSAMRYYVSYDDGGSWALDTTLSA